MFDVYKSLPDYMSIPELQNNFNSFLSQVNSKEYNLADALEALLELADRQWHTYELLEKGIKDKIEEWLINIIDIESEECVEGVTSIIGYLGLKRLYLVLKDYTKSNLPKDIRTIIDEMINELDGHEEDPYHGMK